MTLIAAEIVGLLRHYQGKHVLMEMFALQTLLSVSALYSTVCNISTSGTDGTVGTFENISTNETVAYIGYC